MSLHQLASHMSARGRGPDSTLVHMSPREVEGLQKLAVANGTSLTINPDTGLPEAFSLQDLLPTLIGGAATYFTGGAITPLMAALGTGAVTALTSKDLGKGLMAGLGAYGGAGIVSGLAGFGTGALSAEAGAAATQAAGAATSPLESEILSQAAIAPKLAGASYADKFGAGLSKAMSDPMGAASAIGGGSKIAGLAKVAGAISPLLAGETGNTVQTVTKRPLPRPRQPSVYDNMSQTFERYAANGGLMGLAHGGAVRRFNGVGASLVGAGTTQNLGTNYAGQATSPLITDQVQDMYKNVLDRTKTNDTLTVPEIEYWSGRFGADNTIDANELSQFKDMAQGDITKRQAGNTAYTPISGLNALYQSELGRPGEQAGMDFWKKTFGDYIDPTELAGFKTEAAKERAARPVVVNDKVQNPDVVTDLTTADTKYIAPGVGGSTSAGQIGGGTVINPNGSITTSPVIPGIPVGGFTGMEQVRDTYTKGGGDTGYTSPTYTKEAFDAKYKNTGYQKEMYDYLMGKGDKPTKMKNADGTFREVSRPYNEAVLGVPSSTNVKRIWNPLKGEYFRNPDYMRQRTIRDPDTKAKSTINYMSINQAKAALAKTPLEGNALAEWSIDNFVDPETLAEATGMNQNQVTKLLADAKADKSYVKKVAGGGLLSLANGGLAGVGYADGGLPEKERTNSVTGVKYYFDFDNGIYRAETTVKDGITYKWNPVTNKYETGASNASGIASLLDTTDGSPAGGENSPNPNWDGMTAEQKAAFYDANPTFAAITKAGQKALDFIGITNPLEAAIANGRLGLSGYNNFGKESTIPSGGIVSPGQADTDQDTGPAPAPAAPTDTGSMDSNDVNDTGLLASGGMTGYAQGGLGSLGGYSDGGRLLRGPGNGTSDNIPATIGDRQPARLADGEFVVPARIVSELGNGSTEAGARQLYAMMDRIQKARAKTIGKNKVAFDAKARNQLPA